MVIWLVLVYNHHHISNHDHIHIVLVSNRPYGPLLHGFCDLVLSLKIAISGGRTSHPATIDPERGVRGEFHSFDSQLVSLTA